MSSSTLPRTPHKWAIIAGIAWLLLTLLGASIDDGTRWERFGRDVVTAIGTLLFAFAVGGGVLGWWQQREWEHRTQWVAVDLLNQTMRHAAILASRTAGLLSAWGVDRSTGLAPLYTLPWTSVGDQVLEDVKAEISDTVLSVFDEPPSHPSTPANLGTPYQLAVIDKLRGNNLSLEDHADRIRQLALDLGDYADDVLAVRLLSDAAKLHSVVRDLVDPFPGRQAPEQPWAVLASLNITNVLDATAQIARDLTAVLSDIERRSITDSLRETIARQRADRLEEDQHALKDLKSEREARQTLADFERSGDTFLAGANELFAEIARFSSDPNTSDDARRVVGAQMRELDETLGNLRSALSDADSTSPKNESS